jgi:hypothetical protein
MFLRALGVWILMAALAVAVASVREEILVPRVGEPAGHVVGTVAFLVPMILVIGLTLRWVVPGLEASNLILLGIFWTVATICLEFGFGHFVMGHPWSRMLHDYNLLAGRVWILVPITLLGAPTVLGRLLSAG